MTWLLAFIVLVIFFMIAALALSAKMLSEAEKQLELIQDMEESDYPTTKP